MQLWLTHSSFLLWRFPFWAGLKCACTRGFFVSQIFSSFSSCVNMPTSVYFFSAKFSWCLHCSLCGNQEMENVIRNISPTAITGTKTVRTTRKATTQQRFLSLDKAFKRAQTRFQRNCLILQGYIKEKSCNAKDHKNIAYSYISYKRRVMPD